MTEPTYPPPGDQPQYGQPGQQPQFGQPAQPPQYGQPGQQPPYGEQPQYGQYGQPQYGSDQVQQGGYYTPAPVTRPPAIDKAVLLMKIGAGVAVLSAIVNIAMQSQIDDAMTKWMVDTFKIPAEDAKGSGGTSVLSTVLSTALAVALWWWMAVANGKGRSWARILGTIFFGISVLGSLSVLAVPMPILVKVVSLLSLAVGAAAVWFMWQKESSAYYEAASRTP
jgi:hypothetical protein